MISASISGTGFFVPPRAISNQTLIDDFGVQSSDKWIQERTGIESRRYADDGVGPADMAVIAAQEALSQAKLQAHDLDLILFATLSPEHAFPGSGVYLQEKLGLCEGPHARFVPAIDLRNQCSGFLYGLSTASAHIRAGMAKHVLLVGAEKHSAALDLSMRGRSVATLFGDGAGAVVLSATQEKRGLIDISLGADGRYADILAQKVWDTRRRPFIPTDEQGRGIVEPSMLWAHMDGRIVFKHAVTRMTQSLEELCAANHLDLDAIDLFFFHQANLRINQYVAKKLGIPDEKVPHNIERYGNTTAATLPILLAEATRSGQLKPGMKIALTAFGSGFTWGCALIEW